jgi:rubredoxin
VITSQWSPEEIKVLKDTYGKMKVEDIPLPNRTSYARHYMAHKLGMRHGRRNLLRKTAWTLEQDKLVRNNYGKIPAGEISKLIGKNAHCVHNRAIKLGVSSIESKKHSWVRSIPDLSFGFIERYITGESARKLADEIGISESTFVIRLKEQGIQRRTVAEECRKRLPAMQKIVAEQASTLAWRIRQSAHLQGISVSEWKGFSSDRSTMLHNMPEWKVWRRAVFTRDHYRCVLCGAGYRPKLPLDPHHIKPKARYPELMFDVANGITLCRSCHAPMTRKEHLFEPLFRAYLMPVWEPQIKTYEVKL